MTIRTKLQLHSTGVVAAVLAAIVWLNEGVTLHVEEGPTARGHVYVPYRWSVTAASGEGRRRYTSVQPSS